MKIMIKEYCIRCGLCQDLYPELFKYNSEADAIDIKCDEVHEEFIEKARNAAADCAVTAIFVK